MLHKLLATAVVKRALFATVSVGAHAALASALAVGPSAHPAASVSAAASEIDVSIEAPAPPPAPEVATPPPEKPLDNHAAAHALHHPHTHDYPVPKDHDAHDHDPALHHAADAPIAPAPPASEPNEPPAVAASDAPAPHFKMKLGASSSAAGIVGTPVGGAHAHEDESAAPLAEGEVSEPARLLARAPAAYPAAARDQEIEADVPLEIVVDTRGAVTEARLLRAAGRGFDEAALSAVRGYRFSPAKKDGHLVRVRMRWTVQFKLQ